MRRITLLVVAAVAATAAALALASSSTATEQPYKWFVPTASAVAGPNHTFTLSVGITNMDVKNQLLGQLGIAHTGYVTVSLVGKDFGPGFWIPPIGNVTLNPYPLLGHTWTYTAKGTGVPGVSYGIKINVTHVGQQNDLMPPPGPPAVTASASVIVK